MTFFNKLYPKREIFKIVEKYNGGSGTTFKCSTF
jgi:hypothetical protein